MSSGPLAFQTNAAQGRSVACASEKGVPKSFERLATAIGSQPLHQEKPFSTRPGHSMPRIRIQTAVRRRSVFNSLVLGLATRSSPLQSVAEATSSQVGPLPLIPLPRRRFPTSSMRGFRSTLARNMITSWTMASAGTSAQTGLSRWHRHSARRTQATRYRLILSTQRNRPNHRAALEAAVAFSLQFRCYRRSARARAFGERDESLK